ncbi:MAG: hypothetical protein KDA36_12085, partial [Planctomycetaceae bacterium]|nr:hypothetical protein [Planctomycetaceae bacterium]
MFDAVPRNRSRSGHPATPEQLEIRILPTVDLLLDFVTPGFSQNVVRDQFGAVTVNATFAVEIENAGNTAADLTGGTPDIDADNVFIDFFASSDDTLDGGDTFLGNFNIGLFNTSIGPGGSISFTIGDPFTVPIGPNSAFIIAKVDSTNALAETNETNNLKSVDIRTPTLGITGGGSFLDKKKSLSLDPFIGFLDGDSANYNGGRITVSFVDAQSKEFLQLFRSGKGADKVKLSGTTLKIGNRTVGTVTGNKTADMVIDFTGDLDQFDLQNVLRSIGYKVRSDSPGQRNFTIQLRDPDANDSPIA